MVAAIGHRLTRARPRGGAGWVDASNQRGRDDRACAARHARIVARTAGNGDGGATEGDGGEPSGRQWEPTERTRQTQDPRYKIRATYKRGFAWVVYRSRDQLSQLRAVQGARAAVDGARARALTLWHEDARIQPVRRVIDAMLAAVADLCDAYDLFEYKRGQRRYLWELASVKEAAAAADAALFVLGTAITIVWQVLTPPNSLFWSITLPLGFGYLRSIRPIGVANRPFPWPVIAAFVLAVPFKFGAAIDAAIMSGPTLSPRSAADLALFLALVVVMALCRNLTYNMRWAQDLIRFIQGVSRERVAQLFR